MLSNYSSLYSLLPLLSFSSASQQHILNSDDPGPFTSKFGQLANETLELFHVPGVAVAVVDGDNMWAEVGCPLASSSHIFTVNAAHDFNCPTTMNDAQTFHPFFLFDRQVCEPTKGH